jgi:D-3-phosphoglycerate dehydrogenase
VILTPHIGGLSFETFHAMMKDAVENIVLYEEGNTEMLQNKLL